MHVIAIIGIGWAMIIGAFVFIKTGEMISVKPEVLASLFYVLFFISFYVIIMTRKCFLKPYFINGKIDKYAGYKSFRNFFNDVGIVSKATFNIHNGGRRCYNNVVFRKNIWNSDIKPLCVDGIFFMDKSLFLNKIYIWGAQINGESFVFLDDMNNPSLFVLIFTSIIGFLSLYFGKEDLFFAIIGATILLSFIPTYLIEKRLFNRRMKLLDEAGVPRPLG